MSDTPIPTPPLAAEPCATCISTPCNCKTCAACASQVPGEDICATCQLCTYHACCDCWQCNHCQTAFAGNGTKACANCGWCPNCCRCEKCVHCARIRNRDTFCESCHWCESCCGCGIGINWISPGPEPVFHAATKLEHKFNPSSRYIAMEIEVASVKPGIERPVQDTIQKWGGAIVRDGSLIDTGFEINTAPASGDKFVQEITEICNALKEQKGKIDDRCGLHVHVEARNFDYYDLRKLIFFYAKVEDSLFSIVRRGRRNSDYCHPCGERLVRDLERHRAPKDNRKKVLENVYGREVNVSAVRRERRNPARYAALNLHSVLYRGTVENRMHHGTIDRNTIVNWGLLWAAILDFVYNNTEKEIRGMSGDGIKLLCDVSPSNTVKDWISERHEWFKSHTKE
jgi:Putative amidoligase enzyme